VEISLANELLRIDFIASSTPAERRIAHARPEHFPAAVK
jgi:hypothetical protein